MFTTITRTVFVTALALALIGGLVLIGWQSLGLLVGSGVTVSAPNGVFKTVICVAASIAAVAAYLLTHVTPASATGEGER